MQKILLYQITIILLVQMAAAHPFDNGDLSQLPTAETGSFYPDPDDLLAGAICSLCGFALDYCRCNCHWSPDLDPSTLLNHPEWPATYPNNINDTLSQQNNLPQPFRPQLIVPSNESSNNNINAEYHETSIDGILSSTYNAGDRLSPLSARSSRRPRELKGYSCDLCSSTFDRDCDLNRHKKIHLENEHKPIQCQECGKGFLYPKDLKRHQNTHAPSDKVWFCPVAGCKSHSNGFTRKDNFRRHMRSKHSRSTLDTASVSGASTY